MTKKCLSVTLILFLASCSMFQQAVKTFAEMSPKERAVWMMEVYNAEYNKYLALASMPNLSEDAKTMLRVKKSTLTVVYPLIKTYSSLIAMGLLDKQIEQKTYSLLIQVLTNKKGE